MSETNKKLTENIIAGKLRPDAEDKVIPIQSVEYKKLPPGFPSGLKTLDDMFDGGFREGQLIIISGLSGYGKTEMSIQMTHSYSKQAIPVLFISYEMTLKELQDRFRRIGKKDGDDIEDNKEYDDLLCYVPKKNISDNIKWLEDKIVESITFYNTKVVFIDELSSITVDTKTNEADLVMQRRIVGMLKRITLEHNITIILNVHVHKLDEGKEPRMQNIYGTGDSYKLAHAVIFVHRLKEKVGRGEQALEFTNESKIIVDKNRLTGKLGQFKVIFKDNKFSLIDNTHKEDETN